MNREVVLSCRDLQKSYHEGPQDVTVLKGINLEVCRGERVAIIGSSGSGKSTLLNLLAGIDLPDCGVIEVAGRDLAHIREKERAALRNSKLGFVYQFHHLLPEFTALENVCMPLLIGDTSVADARRRGSEILQRVGLAERLSHKPAELSGGERQRVAIARALVTTPECVLLDEPTGNLDWKTAESVLQLLLDLNREFAVSFVMVTHEGKFAERMDRTYELSAGRLEPVTA